jgi:hypothetical protein
MGASFEGKIYSPGRVLERSELPAPLVVLECAGPTGPARGHRRAAVVWILWEWRDEQWIELARSAAVNWEWTLDLRGPALRALHPDRELFDVLREGRELAEGILDLIDKRLETEREDLRQSTLGALYDRVSARMSG